MKAIAILSSSMLLLTLPLYGQSLVGAWTATVSTDNTGNTTTIRFVMQADSTFTFDEDSDGSPESRSTYRIDGNQITFTIADEYCTGKSVCDFELREDGNILYLKPVSIDCPNTHLPPPMTLSREKDQPR